ncbi:MAG: tyrosine--tRNA ligase, partial [Candidatus Solibacter usitatus]|nr:tyrosine--tRNA ligase [Candidatus Solibacter usitatus]
ADIVTLALPEGVRGAAGHIRVDKLLPKIGLADSVTDATRKIKAGAVEINGQRLHELAWASADSKLLVQVGRNWRQVTL